MTTDTTQIERLDFTAPPSGYDVWEDDGDRDDDPMDWDCVGWYFGRTADKDEVLPADGEPVASKAAAIAAAWSHCKECNDPPGIHTVNDVVFGWGFRIERDMCELYIINGGEFAARAAAWAWYERRVALSKRLSTGPFAPLTCECSSPPKAWDGKGASLCRHVGEYLRLLAVEWWLRCLAWSDDQVAVVERWLAEGGEVPEVLREG